MATPQTSEIIAAGAILAVTSATIPQIMLSDVAVIVVFASAGSILSSLFRADLSTTKSKVVSALAGFILGGALTWVGSLYIGNKFDLPFQSFLPAIALISSAIGDKWVRWMVSPPDYIKNLIYKFAPFLEPKK